MRLVRLKARRQFLHIAKQGRKTARATLVLQSIHLSDAAQTKAKALARVPGRYPAAYLGFTASKKVGNAVARNRAKRRLTAAARQMLPRLAQPGQAIVLIARAATVGATYAQIERDLAAAMKAT